MGMHVLLVEDIDDAREMLALILEMEGAVVVAAASAAEALGALDRHDFQILVSDIGLPDMNGYDLVRRIRAHEAMAGGFLPAVAVTAFTSEADRREALRAGFQYHCPKPIALDDLVSLMTSLAEDGQRGDDGRVEH
jgi:CheY-like chemotaxis protein